MTRTLLISLLSGSLLLVACGDDGGDNGGTPRDAGDSTPDAPALDAPPPDAAVVCAERLDPVDDGSGVMGGGPMPVIVISEVKPQDYVEVYNSTDQPVDLTTLGWIWCSVPGYRSLASAAVTVPAFSYQRLAYPTGSSDEANGEMALYLNSSYTTSTSVVDFVCWGNGNSPSTRKGPAEGALKWTGACAPSIPTGGSLHRKIGVGGTSAADYDVTLEPSGQSCTPDPPQD